MKTLLGFALAFGLGMARAHEEHPVSMRTDSQINGIVTTVNTVEMDAAQLAKTTSHNARVKAFAEHVYGDHSSNKRASLALAKRKAIPMEETEKSRELREHGQATAAKLRQLTGKDFDKAYVDGQVAAHQMVLEELEQSLIPSAHDKELKAHLERTRDKVSEHLSQARRLQRSL